MTSSKKIKRNIGASLRLAPFGHVRSITFTIMLLAVALIFGCRKSGGGGGITQTDPIKNLTGNLLIVSADGMQGANSLPLSFVGASATVTEVKEDQPKLNLDPTNFIVENNALKLTKFDLSTADAAVSNKVTLTFSLSGENLSRYTDTADIFVGKMQTNIGTNDLATKISKAINNDKDLNADANKNKLFEFEYNYSLSENTDYLVFTNNKAGNAANELSIKRFSDVISTNIIDKNWKSHSDSYRLENTIENGTNLITKLIFEPTIFYNSYNFKFVIQNGGKWIESDGQEGK